MPTSQKIVHLSHLLSTNISKTVNQDLILDTLFRQPDLMDTKVLKQYIIDFFGVDVPENIIKKDLKSLQQQGLIIITASGKITLSDLKRLELSKVKLEETAIFELAFSKWTSANELFSKASKNEIKALKHSVEIFLNRLFITHGASCIKLLIQNSDATEFDINGIANDVASQFVLERNFLKVVLSTIFSALDSREVLEYLELKLNQAIVYLSSVLPEDLYNSLLSRLNDVTVYLDTNFLYRLLDLQGESRFKTAVDTVQFCKNAGILLCITAETYKELTTSIRRDAKILIDHPIKTNLAQFGYKYRTEDNYVSSYWRKASVTKISVNDYNESFSNPSIILTQQYGIDVEEYPVDMHNLKALIEDFYTKIYLHSSDDDEKSDSAAWHDAYCLATVKLKQQPSANSSIESKCLFLTTDKQLISMQIHDSSLKKQVPLALTPSQLLQLFSFSTSAENYIETFVTLFSSASINRSNAQYNNTDIQDILSRISHYECSSYATEVAESILENQLLNGNYSLIGNAAEREESIYNAVSHELLIQLDKEKQENIQLQSSTNNLESELAQKNKEIHDFQMKQQIDADKINAQLCNTDLLIDKEAERRFKWWRIGHIACMVAGVSLILAGTLVICFFVHQYFSNQIGSFPIAQIVATTVIGGIGIPCFRFGFKVTSPNIKEEIKTKYNQEYRNELKNEISYDFN